MESLDLPQLRSDLELFPLSESLLVHDPVRREVFELDTADLPVLRLLDGQHAPAEVARRTRRSLDDVLDLVDDLADLLLLVDPDQDELLAAWRAERETEDRLLQPALDSVPAAGVAALPLHIVDEARHACLRCGACCHYAIPISSAERRRLEAYPWPEEVVPEEAGRLFNVQPCLQWGGVEETIAARSSPTCCAFLTTDNLCRVHGALGPAAKPFPCRLFPLAFPVLTPDQVVFSLTFECPWIWQTYDEGERLADRAAELAGLAAEMDELYALPAEVPLDGERTLRAEAYLAWERGLLDTPGAPATDPAWFLESVQSHWEELVPGGPSVVPPLAELAGLARTMGRTVRENRAVVMDCPEGEEGADAALVVLESLAARPETAWADVRWEDEPAADRFLGRFVRHFVEGKQVLFYPNLWTGLRALVVSLLLARRDALLVERAAGREQVSLAALNRALARWCRLLDLRPVRLAFLEVTTKTGRHQVSEPRRHKDTTF
jgi:Fe-S-cluster containining protein